MPKNNLCGLKISRVVVFWYQKYISIVRVWRRIYRLCPEVLLWPELYCPMGTAVKQRPSSTGTSTINHWTQWVHRTFNNSALGILIASLGSRSGSSHTSRSYKGEAIILHAKVYSFAHRYLAEDLEQYTIAQIKNIVSSRFSRSTDGHPWQGLYIWQIRSKLSMASLYVRD